MFETYIARMKNTTSTSCKIWSMSMSRNQGASSFSSSGLGSDLWSTTWYLWEILDTKIFFMKISKMQHNIWKCHSQDKIRYLNSKGYNEWTIQQFYFLKSIAHLSVAIKNLCFSKIVSTGLTKTISLTNVQHFVLLSRDQGWYPSEGQQF